VKCQRDGGCVCVGQASNEHLPSFRCIASRKSSFFAHATGLFFRAERCSFGSFSALAPCWKKWKSRGRIERKKEDCAEASGNPFVAAIFQAFGKRREKWNEG
jgi:hypothetical protein